jgi:hypothetical protein
MPNSVPTLSGLGTPAVFQENTVNNGPQIIDADVALTDPDNNFNGGTLTVSGLLAEDTVAIRNQGAGAGQIGVSGTNVTFGGTVIGTFAGGAGSTLTVTFNASATVATIEALIENLTYANSSDTPTASRSLDIKVNDAAGFASIAPITFAAAALNPFGLADVGSYGAPSFADLDGDGDLDAIVGNTSGNLNYFKNTGAGLGLTVNVTAQSDPPTAVALANTTTSIAENTPTVWPSFIKVADIIVTDDGLGTNTLGLTGADAVSFRQGGIFLTDLSRERSPASLACSESFGFTEGIRSKLSQVAWH